MVPDYTGSLLTVFPAHASGDALFASELTAFLEAGCDWVRFATDSVMEGTEDLLAAADRAESADVLILLISKASNPQAWSRPVWEPLLVKRPADNGTQVAVLLLEDCIFPGVLGRGSRFFDARTDRQGALRRLKRWLRGLQAGVPPAMHFSSDLEELYRVLDDQPGTLTVAGPIAERFAHEAARDFDSVLWIAAYGRNLTQIAGEVGAQLGMTLEGTVESNCSRGRAELARRRCLLVLDGPEVAVDALLPQGMTSVLLTSEPTRIEAPELTLEAARKLFAARRLAEAYELYYELLHAGADAESCARDLIWICECWDRLEEANNLRFHLGPEPSEQLRLF